MAIYSGFTYSKWWFSIVMLVYQRVYIYIYLDVPFSRWMNMKLRWKFHLQLPPIPLKVRLFWIPSQKTHGFLGKTASPNTQAQGLWWDAMFDGVHHRNPQRIHSLHGSEKIAENPMASQNGHFFNCHLGNAIGFFPPFLGKAINHHKLS